MGPWPDEVAHAPHNLNAQAPNPFGAPSATAPVSSSVFAWLFSPVLMESICSTAHPLPQTPLAVPPRLPTPLGALLLPPTPLAVLLLPPTHSVQRLRAAMALLLPPTHSEQRLRAAMALLLPPTHSEQRLRAAMALLLPPTHSEQRLRAVMVPPCRLLDTVLPRLGMVPLLPRWAGLLQPLPSLSALGQLREIRLFRWKHLGRLSTPCLESLGLPRPSSSPLVDGTPR
jgi:hypothetical protein